MDAITNTVVTKTWADNGGTGTIDHYDRTLAISQTREVHMQIAQFLAGLRPAAGNADLVRRTSLALA